MATTAPTTATGLTQPSDSPSLQPSSIIAALNRRQVTTTLLPELAAIAKNVALAVVGALETGQSEKEARSAGRKVAIPQATDPGITNRVLKTARRMATSAAIQAFMTQATTPAESPEETAIRVLNITAEAAKKAIPAPPPETEVVIQPGDEPRMQFPDPLHSSSLTQPIATQPIRPTIPAPVAQTPSPPQTTPPVLTTTPQPSSLNQPILPLSPPPLETAESQTTTKPMKHLWKNMGKAGLYFAASVIGVVVAGLSVVGTAATIATGSLWLLIPLVPAFVVSAGITGILFYKFVERASKILSKLV